eukprot:CAMPEP_0183742478 /NCGR_PEP_ID=MMETSP0737-20130205/64720_1 /TAXON_ID=385413 /ORGANISM="Thalassiosira miniscula, Strain CCMP1093" /LENGTH=156 /DNA_ID=CAMNT_0025978065 /DNA_START=45 /DNA_END=515 /DNA_ORIENTATION=-
MNTPAFETVHSIFSPVDASKLSGRYETTAKDKAGKPVPVLRSLRHAPKELVIRGSITPKKVQPSSDDLDNLCDLFQNKASVTPIKKRSSSSKKSSATRTKSTVVSKRHAKKNADEVESVKENLGEALKMMFKSVDFSDDTKAAAVAPTKRGGSRKA